MLAQDVIHNKNELYGRDVPLVYSRPVFVANSVDPDKTVLLRAV